jgi:hypothetical protein
MPSLRIAFGALAALRAVLIYGEAQAMQEPQWAQWAQARAERLAGTLSAERPIASIPGNEPAWHTVNP